MDFRRPGLPSPPARRSRTDHGLERGFLEVLQDGYSTSSDLWIRCSRSHWSRPNSRWPHRSLSAATTAGSHGCPEKRLRGRIHRPLMDDHPIDAEPIAQLAEPGGEERL